MSTIWQELATELETFASRYSWECDVAFCDGLPHPGNENQHGRHNQQLPRGEWQTWMLKAGRGFGKSRAGSESFLSLVERNPRTITGDSTEWLIAAPTYSDTREVMVNGPSGLIAAMERRGIAHKYNRASGLITLESGQRIHMKSGDIDLGRGFSLSGCWLDEVLTWRHAYVAYFEGLLPALRQQLSHDQPRVILTSTPKAVGASLLAALQNSESFVMTSGSTFDNERNLSQSALDAVRAAYPVGSRLYRIELEGEWVEEIEGSLWKQEWIDDNRVGALPEEVMKSVVAVDPAVSAGKNSDLTGIVLVSSSGVSRADKHFYVQADKSLKGTPHEWARTAVMLAADNGAEVIYEENNGGLALREALAGASNALLEQGVIDFPPVIRNVRATRNKATRAQPISGLYEMGKVHHVGGFTELEAQQTSWVPSVTKKSPDRVDALVWAITHLMRGGRNRAAGAF